MIKFNYIHNNHIHNQALFSVGNKDISFSKNGNMQSSNDSHRLPLLNSIMQLIKNLIEQLQQNNSSPLHRKDGENPNKKSDGEVGHQALSLNANVRAFLDANYRNAQIIDNDDNGQISVGDSLIYKDGSGNFQTQTLDQTLANKLNDPNLGSGGLSSPPGEAGHQALSLNASVRAFLDANYRNAQILDNDDNGQISEGDSLIYKDGSGNFQTQTVDQTLANKLNDPNLRSGGLSSPPGEVGHQALSLNPSVRAFLDANYRNAQIIDHDDNGQISVGDSLIYKDGSGNFQTQTLDQTLADKLNDPNLGS